MNTAIAILQGLHHSAEPPVKPNIFAWILLVMNATILVTWAGATLVFWPLLVPFAPVAIGLIVILPSIVIYIPSYVFDVLERKVDRWSKVQDKAITSVPQSLHVKATLMSMLCTLVFMASFGEFYQGAAWVEAAAAFVNVLNDLSVNLQITFAWPEMPEFAMNAFLVFKPHVFSRVK